jgi:Glycosyl hydrolases family 18
MTIWQALLRPPWRTVVPGLAFLSFLFLGYWLWSPGIDIRDGRHDLGHNGIWLQHGWLGADNWFQENKKVDRMATFRSAEHIHELAVLLQQHHITDVYPHLCPTQPNGGIPSVDAPQTRRFLQEFTGFRVMPWIGGNLDIQVKLHNPKWRSTFIHSISTLLNTYTNFSGVHLNIEPLPSGNKEFLQLLDELHAALPKGKLLSLAAYPPPTRWQPSLEVHWEESYFREVARRADQMVVMMYDTSINHQKLYQSLMSAWTKEVLTWAPGKNVLLGVPTYEDANTSYHDPRVENVSNSLLGIHRGLADLRLLPPNYQGIAIYSEWEISAPEWNYLREHFLRP